MIDPFSYFGKDLDLSFHAEYSRVNGFLELMIFCQSAISFILSLFFTFMDDKVA